MVLEGKKALITGGSSGIGLATAKLFQKQGARIAITGQNPAHLKEAAAELGPDTLTIVADARSVAQTSHALSQIHDVFGSLDVLFVNAGAAFLAPLQEITEAHLDEMMGINFRGAFFTIQKAVPLMPHGSSIILNTSWLGKVGLAGTSILSASKAAVRSLARTLSAELVPLGIRVNAVSPGAISTGIYGKMNLPAEQLQQLASSIQESIPMHRFGAVEDIANAALFLAGEGSAYMLGSEIVVDGGLSQL